MSSASIPPPRTKSPTDKRSSGPWRPTLFLPVLIFLLGSGSLALYQVLALTDQLDQLNQTGDRLDARVKHATYEKTKFFRIARDVLALADKDPNADAVATRFKLRKLAEAKPELLNASAPSEFDLSNVQSTQAGTNAAPVRAVPVTNSAPEKPASSP